MAMISFKHLVAPVSNSVHLASIVFIVLVFGVWRWSGGEVNFVRGTRSISTLNSEKEAIPKPASIRENSRDPRAAPPVNQNSGVVQIPAEAADDLLGSILHDKQPTRSAAPAKRAEGKPRSANSLEDIERSLGIR
jgi:hypothetical protein